MPFPGRGTAAQPEWTPTAHSNPTTASFADGLLLSPCPRCVDQRDWEMSEEDAASGAGDGDKRAPRIKLSEIAALELDDGRTIGVVVSDVSAAGFRVAVSEPVEIG